VSVHKTPTMTVTIKVEDGESIDLALRKLSKKVKSEMDRRWYKRRFGYYEKPSVLKRKNKKMKKLVIQSGGALWLKIGLKEQFSRNGGSAAGR
jgi:ribosomal protein S21